MDFFSFNLLLRHESCAFVVKGRTRQSLAVGIMSWGGRSLLSAEADKIPSILSAFHSAQAGLFQRCQSCVPGFSMGTLLIVVMKILVISRFSVVAGGVFNDIQELGNLSSVAGGAWNVVTGVGAAIGGGIRNSAAAAYADLFA